MNSNEFERIRPSLKRGSHFYRDPILNTVKYVHNDHPWDPAVDMCSFLEVN